MSDAPQNQPRYLIFAGVNGAGKTTLYKSGIWENGFDLSAFKRVNPDEILLELGLIPNDPRSNFLAAREAVRRIDRYFADRTSFTQETTLSGLKSLQDIQKAKRAGYEVVMFYIGVDSPQIAEQRVQHRFELGGHTIDAQTIARRYDASLKHLKTAIGLCDQVHIFDNTGELVHLRDYEHGHLKTAFFSRPNSWLAATL
jgi:predicted ABC-type ATPase